jgi:transcription initiation factor TFIIE subunit alpha
MASAHRTMEDAQTLLRTVVRTFFPSARQILAIETLIRHKALHLEDYQILLNAQGRELRGPIQPLRTARLISTGSKAEVRVGQVPIRQVQREYHYIDWRIAIDAIKYRVLKLRTRVEGMYALDQTKRKDWLCPYCKAEYDELQVLDKIGPEGFYCERCSHTLILNEAAQRDRGSHEKIRRLNDQLSRLMDLIGKINPDLLPASDGLFQRVYTEKVRVPRPRDRESTMAEYLDADIAKGREKRLEEVKVENLQIKLTSGAEHDKAEVEREEQRRKEIAKQNMLPVWHTQSAIGMQNAANNATVKSEEANVVGLKKEEEDEKKPEITGGQEMQDEVAAYMAEMEKERQEQEEKARDESEAEEEDESEDDDEGDFEDVLETGAVGTPTSTQDESVKREAPTSNGVKRELEDESSEAATPASMEREAKRVKVDTTELKEEVNGTGPIAVIRAEADGDSDEDEEFEDVKDVK